MCGQVPLRRTPVEEDGGGSEPVACLESEADLIPTKPCTDVVVHGYARTPGAEPCTRLMTGVTVGGLRKRVLVTGDRRLCWRRDGAHQFSSATPFTALPLTWRRAFGGIDAGVPPRAPGSGGPDPALDDVAHMIAHLQPENHPGAYPRNPAGTGWVVRGDARSVDGLALPNFEDPADLLAPERCVWSEPGAWRSAPTPAGYGWLAHSWFPRSAFLGVGVREPPSRALAETRAGWFTDPVDPREVDPRFWSGASPGMRAVGLEPGHAVELLGLHVEGPLRTCLPSFPEVQVVYQRGLFPVATPRLHTVELFPDQALATLVWVAQTRVDGSLPLSFPDASAEPQALFEDVCVLLDGEVVPRECMR